MKRFLACALLFAVVPMVFLNPLGRPAFLGYYLGVIAMWLALLSAGFTARGAEVRSR